MHIKTVTVINNYSTYSSYFENELNDTVSILTLAGNPRIVLYRKYVSYTINCN